MPPDAPAPLSDDQHRRLLGLIGLGIRSRRAVVGVQQVRAAVQRGRVVLAIVAPDVSRHSRDKILPLLKARGIVTVEGPDAARLGAAAGKDTTAVVGIVDENLARGIREVVEFGS